MDNPLVSFRNVAKSYKWFKALHDVSFDLRQGEVFGYIGPNGAGKTTTMKILVGLLKKFEGEVVVDGLRMPQDHHKVHRLIGYLPQGPGFQNWRTVNEALMSLGQLSDVSKADLEKLIPTYLDRFELGKFRHKKVKKLSGGMKQKVGLIQALLHKPRLLVMDEPLSGLDPQSRLQVKELVRELQAQGTTIIFSSHILSDVQDVADRMGIIFNGRILQIGNLDELKRHFGIPNDIQVEFSTIPTEVDFLNQVQGCQEVKQIANNHYSLQLSQEADLDDPIDKIIKETIRLNGRIRKIGNIAPNLDDLYKRFVREAAKKELESNE